MSVIKCAFCKGKGKDPFNLLSKLAACQVCGGTGKIKVDEPMIECAFCKGGGAHQLPALPVTEKAALHFKGLKRNVLIVKAPVIR